MALQRAILESTWNSSIREDSPCICKRQSVGINFYYMICKWKIFLGGEALITFCRLSSIDSLQLKTRLLLALICLVRFIVFYGVYHRTFPDTLWKIILKISWWFEQEWSPGACLYECPVAREWNCLRGLGSMDLLEKACH